jgi:pyruvate,water dikinase
VLINAAWGLGENVVQGAVDPDEYQVYKPFLDNPACHADRRKARARGQGHQDDLRERRRRDEPRNVPTSKAERAAFVLRR